MRYALADKRVPQTGNVRKIFSARRVCCLVCVCICVCACTQFRDRDRDKRVSETGLVLMSLDFAIFIFTAFVARVYTCYQVWADNPSRRGT